MPLPPEEADRPTFKHWFVNIMAENTSDLSHERDRLDFEKDLPTRCFDECMKNCTSGGLSKCFGKVYHSE